MRFIFLHKKEPCIAAELQGFAEDEASLLRKDHSDYRCLLRKPLASSFASYSPTGSQPERCGLFFCIKKSPASLQSSKVLPATCYSPTGSLRKYHRRWRA